MHVMSPNILSAGILRDHLNNPHAIDEGLVHAVDLAVLGATS